MITSNTVMAHIEVTFENLDQCTQDYISAIQKENQQLKEQVKALQG